ncbi:MAG: ATP-binding protein, partial [Thermomicrobiales bacterium]
MAETFPVEPDRTSPGPRPLAPRWSRRWQGFPTTLPPLIGREQEVAAVLALVHEPGRHLITLTGPGGVGKTRLALAVAKEIEPEFADGAVFVPLAAVSDPALVIPTIARALEIRDTRERSLAEALLVALRDRHLLLVLDNFEHLMLPGMTAAASVAHLLQACPTVTAFVTSRAPLHLSGEQRFLTPPLALPAVDAVLSVDTLDNFGAIAFFVERARWVSHNFVLSEDNAAAIADICRQLDGLPLAIELAAPWIRALTAEELLQRLEHRLPLLQGGADDQPARLRTMRDAIAWSYDLLTVDEAQLFRRLAVFVGGFTLEAVERIACVESPIAIAEPAAHSSSSRFPPPATTDPLDLLAGLIDKGLLQPTQLETQESRFTLLETVREFALERLAESGEAGVIESAHAAYVRDLTERAEPHLLGPQERRWHARCDAELGNLRAALAWALEHDVEAALRIGAALWAYWAWHHLAEGRRWLTDALARSETQPDLLRTRA